MSELRKRLEEVRSRVKTSVERVKGQIPFLESKGFRGQLGDFKIGGGRIAGVTEDITKTAQEYVNSLKEGKITETLRVAPLRRRLEKRFPQLSKLPKIREIPPHEKVAGIPPTPMAPRVKEEALAKKKPEISDLSKRSAIF